ENLDCLGKLRKVEGRCLRGDQKRRPRLLRPASLAEQRLHRRAAPAKDRGALPSCPDARRQERLKGDGRFVQWHGENGGIERCRDGLAKGLPGERVFLGLECEVSDAKPGSGHRPLAATRWSGG